MDSSPTDNSPQRPGAKSSFHSAVGARSSTALASAAAMHAVRLVGTFERVSYLSCRAFRMAHNCGWGVSFIKRREHGFGYGDLSSNSVRRLTWQLSKLRFHRIEPKQRLQVCEPAGAPSMSVHWGQERDSRTLRIVASRANSPSMSATIAAFDAHSMLHRQSASDAGTSILLPHHLDEGCRPCVARHQ